MIFSQNSIKNSLKNTLFINNRHFSPKLLYFPIKTKNFVTIQQRSEHYPTPSPAATIISHGVLPMLQFNTQCNNAKFLQLPKILSINELISAILISPSPFTSLM